MASIMIGRRGKLCRFVESALLTYLEMMASSLEELLQPHLKDDESMPNFRLVLRLFRRHLCFIREKLLAADKALLNELDDDAAVRDERDEAQSEAYSLLIKIRASLTNSHGPRSLEAFGFENRTETEPHRLLNQSLRVQEILQDLDTPLPPALFEGIKIDREALGKVVEDANERLGNALDKIDVEKREGDDAQIYKDQTQDEFDTGYLWIARIVEACLRLINKPELADRIRPSQTRLIIDDAADTEIEALVQEAEGAEPTVPAEPTNPTEPAEPPAAPAAPQSPASTP